MFNSNTKSMKIFSKDTKSNNFASIASDDSEADDVLNSSVSTTISNEEAQKLPNILTRKSLEAAILGLKTSQSSVVLPPTLLTLASRKIIIFQKKKIIPRPDPRPVPPKPKIDEFEEIRRNLRMALNILAEENYDTIKLQILDLASKSSEQCDTALKFIIQHAWDQPKYRNLYAKLCQFLNNSERMPKDGAKKVFYRSLVNELQKVFKNSGRDYSEIKPEEVSEFRFREQRKQLANICFVGELYNHRVIKRSLVKLITEDLLRMFLEIYAGYKVPQQKPKFIVHEDVLENLISLYETIRDGSFEEDSRAEVESNKAELFVQSIETALKKKTQPNFPRDISFSQEHIFKIFGLFITNCTLTPRLDALLKNIIARRQEKLSTVAVKEIVKPYEKPLVKPSEKPVVKQEPKKLTIEAFKKPAKPTTSKLTFQVLSNDEDSASDDEDEKEVKLKPQRPKFDEKLTKSSTQIFNQIYKSSIDSEFSEVSDRVIERFQEIEISQRAKCIALGYLMTFHDARESVILSTRIPLLKDLLRKKAFGAKEFEFAFEESLWSLDVEESPKAPSYYAKVLCDFLESTGVKLKISELLKDVLKVDKDHPIVEFKEKFFERLNGLIESSSKLQFFKKEVKSFV